MSGVNLVKSLLLITILAKAIKSQNLHQTPPIKGCVQWYQVINGCYSCYRRKTSTRGGCGPLLPVSDHCLIYNGDPQQGSLKCALCKRGYSPTISGNCALLNIFNCVSGQFFTNGGKRCTICGNGQYPSADGQNCVPGGSFNSVEYCDWGNSKRSCSKCYSGFTASFDGKECIPWNLKNFGCWYLTPDGTKCLACDAFAGYSQQADGSCVFVKQ